MRVDHLKKTNYQVRDNIATQGDALLSITKDGTNLGPSHPFVFYMFDRCRFQF